MRCVIATVLLVAMACGRTGYDPVVPDDANALDDAGSCGEPEEPCCDGICEAGLQCVSGTCSCFGQVAAGHNYTCTVMVSGQVWCWGAGGRGQLGDGAATNSTVAVQVMGIDFAGQVALGGRHSCARNRNDGGIHCWGRNEVGQLGDGTTTPSPVPLRVIDTYGTPMVGSRHTCSHQGGPSVYCWGCGTYGYDPGDQGLCAVVMAGVVEIVLPDNVVELESRSWHTCGLLADRTVHCWGNNEHGQLGDGTSIDSEVPLAVDLVPVVSLATGRRHTCAALADGSAWCWGENSSGQLGDGTIGVDRLTPVQVVGLSGVVEVRAGGWHTCARTADGAVFCWGYNDTGQLGDGTITTAQLTPTRVLGMPDAAEIALGTKHTCARAVDGRLWCWGWNLAGQLGDGTNTDSLVPLPVPLSCSAP